jgi:hypothetical protein
MVFPLLWQQQIRLAAVATIVAVILIPVKTPHEVGDARSSAGDRMGRPDGFDIALRGFRC